jgi:tetratricopeptide (TPR) repeat protein
MADVLLASTGTSVLPPARPQPLGVFALPAGLLLVPGGAETEPARLALLTGRLPECWPPALRAHQLALAGELDAALATLAGTDPVTRYNRFVIDPGAEEPAVLRRDLGPDLAVLVDLVCFMLGRSDDPPAVGTSAGELAALVLAARATQAVSAGNAPRAGELLTDAVEHALGVSAPLAGVLLGAAASIRQDAQGPGREVTDMLEHALQLLEDTDLHVARAELHLALASARHELAGDGRDSLMAAVRHYHSALQLVTSEQAPEVFAAAHANLAVAYLAMPMVQAGDQLRVGVAVQSLRAALTVYTAETHPQRWASAQLNLANALVYAPSKHRGDNLVEAVERYQTVLDVRDRQLDPLGRARVLANQGNALAHLGAFGQARARLAEARFLFEEFQDIDAVRTVRDVLDEIARQRVLAETEK